MSCKVKTPKYFIAVFWGQKRDNEAKILERFESRNERARFYTKISNMF